jgi:hypothetical protein
MSALLKPRPYPGACSTDGHEGGPYPLDRHLESTPPWVMDLLAFGKGYEPMEMQIATYNQRVELAPSRRSTGVLSSLLSW